MTSHDSGVGSYTVCETIANGFRCTKHYYDWVHWLWGGLALVSVIAIACCAYEAFRDQ